MAVNEKELELIVKQILNQMSGSGAACSGTVPEHVTGGSHPENGSSWQC